MVNEQIAVGLHENAATQLAKQYKHGELIPDEIMRGLACIDALGDSSSPVTRDQVHREMASWANFIGRVSEAMLTKHSMRMVRESNGYRIMLPREQTSHGMAEWSRIRRTADRRVTATLAHVDRSQLSDEERQENEQARSKVAHLLAVEARTMSAPLPKLPDKKTA